MELSKNEIKSLIKSVYWEIKDIFPRAKNIKIRIKNTKKGMVESKVSVNYEHYNLYTRNLGSDVYDALNFAEQSLLHQISKKKRQFSNHQSYAQRYA